MTTWETFKLGDIQCKYSSYFIRNATATMADPNQIHRTQLHLLVCCPWRRESTENIYSVSKGSFAVWSCQMYWGKVLLAQASVLKRWIIYLYRDYPQAKNDYGNNDRSFIRCVNSLSWGLSPFLPPVLQDHLLTSLLVIRACQSLRTA